MTALVSPTSRSISAPSTVAFWLRAEGLAAFAAGVALYGALGGQWLFVLPLLLAPDIAAAGYLANPRIGAFTYNLFHNWAIGLAALGVGIWLAATPVMLAGAILVAHVGMDRAAGYGLKYPTFFKDTHFKRI
jgi:hypothetical protein